MLMLTVQDVKKRYAVSEQTVIGWIKSGELKAVNVGRKLGNKKPRWRISEEAIKAFEASRTPTLEIAAPRKIRKRSGDVIEFIK